VSVEDLREGLEVPITKSHPCVRINNNSFENKKKVLPGRERRFAGRICQSGAVIEADHRRACYGKGGQIARSLHWRVYSTVHALRFFHLFILSVRTSIIVGSSAITATYQTFRIPERDIFMMITVVWTTPVASFRWGFGWLFLFSGLHSIAWAAAQRRAFEFICRRIPFFSRRFGPRL
jgi:hypothetical protein